MGERKAKPIMAWGQKTVNVRDPFLFAVAFRRQDEAMRDIGRAWDDDWRKGYKAARKNGYRVVRIEIRERPSRRKPQPPKATR